MNRERKSRRRSSHVQFYVYNDNSDEGSSNNNENKNFLRKISFRAFDFVPCLLDFFLLFKWLIKSQAVTFSCLPSPRIERMHNELRFIPRQSHFLGKLNCGKTKNWIIFLYFRQLILLSLFSLRRFLHKNMSSSKFHYYTFWRVLLLLWGAFYKIFSECIMMGKLFMNDSFLTNDKSYFSWNLMDFFCKEFNFVEII